MLFKKSVLDDIAKGRITLAFRRWKRPTVNAASTLKTPIGVLAIRSVDIVDEADIPRDDAERAGFASLAELKRSLAGREGRLYRIAFDLAGDDPRIALRENDELTAVETQKLTDRLRRLDVHSKVGPWTHEALQLLEQRPNVRAAELAARSRFEKEWLKSNIRKLKNLGLTESLQTGYRLSPRGKAYLDAALRQAE